MNGLISIFLCLLVFIVTSKFKIYNSFLKSFSLIWFSLLGIYYLFQDRFIPFSSKFDSVFYLFFLGAIIAYIFSSYIFSKLNLKLLTFKPIFNVNAFYLIALLFFLISLFRFLYYILEFGLMDFRILFLEENLSLSVGISFPMVAGAYYLSEVVGDLKTKKLLMLMMFVLAAMSTSKIFFVIFIIFISGFYKEKFKFNPVQITFLVFLGFIFFAIIHLLTNRIAGDFDDSFLGILEALVFTMVGYLIGGLAVFQSQLNGHFNANIIYDNFLLFLINKPSIVYDLETVQWVKTGEWVGNVYSGFSNWYFNGEELSILFLGCFIGVLYSFIFYYAKYSYAINYIKIFSFYPLIFFVFSDTYIAATKIWLAFCIVSFIICITNFQKRLL